MTRTRIYRTQRGWTIERRDPSGGMVRDTYPTGEAAMIALDPRNRPRRPAPRTSAPTSSNAFGAFVDQIMRGFTRDIIQPLRRSDFERRA